MTDSSLPPEDELDRLDPLSVASAAIDGELGRDESADSSEVTADRAALQPAADLVRGTPLPSPPPGLATMQIAAAMEHFDAAPAEGHTPQPAPIAQPIDLTERRIEKEAAQKRAADAAAEMKRQAGGRRLQLLSRVAGVALILGALGGLIAVLNQDGDDLESATTAAEVGEDSSDDASGASRTTEAMEEAGAAEAEVTAADTDAAEESADPLGTAPTDGSFAGFVEDRGVTLVLLPSFTSADEAVLQGQVQLLPPSDSFCAEQLAEAAAASNASAVQGVAFVIRDGQALELAAFEDAEGAFATAVYLDPSAGCVTVA